MSLAIEIERGDITRQSVDAIVNAANSSLMGGGGVDGAIHRAAGPALLEECRALRSGPLLDGLPTGRAVATGAGKMPCQWVIHTVGPRRWEHADGGASLLAACHLSSLDAAVGVGARSIAFPAISCGAFGWDAEEAAPIAIAAVRQWADAQTGVTDSEMQSSGVDLVRFVLFDEHGMTAFRRALAG